MPDDSDRDRLVRVETKLDILLERREDHETRLRVVEGWRMRVIGWAAGAGTFSGALTGLIVWAIAR